MDLAQGHILLTLVKSKRSLLELHLGLLQKIKALLIQALVLETMILLGTSILEEKQEVIHLEKTTMETRLKALLVLAITTSL